MDATNDRTYINLLKIIKMFRKIEDCMLLGIEANFKKEISGFLISLKKDDKEEIVLLPLDHLSEHKIVKYMELMISKF